MRTLWNLLIRCVATAAGLWVVTKLIDGVRVVADGTEPALVFLAAAAVIVVVNMLVGPILKLVGMPLTILSLGLFSLVINAILLLLAGGVAQSVGLGLSFDSFGSAVAATIIMGVVGWLLAPLTALLRR